MQCSDDLMKVDIVLLENNIDPSNVYLEGMKGYPDPKCQPTFSDHVARFQLSLLDFYECGVTRIVYKLNVRNTFIVGFFLFILCFPWRRNVSDS